MRKPVFLLSIAPLLALSASLGIHRAGLPPYLPGILATAAAVSMVYGRKISGGYERTYRLRALEAVSPVITEISLYIGMLGSEVVPGPVGVTVMGLLLLNGSVRRRLGEEFRTRTPEITGNRMKVVLVAAAFLAAGYARYSLFYGALVLGGLSVYELAAVSRDTARNL
ncbi:MAG: hypothetical protein ABEK01_03815 [Candidatus Nanohaloarchaea archaeon]